MVYIRLEGIENNRVSDWLKKESTPPIACSIVPQARNLQPIEKLVQKTL